MNLDTIAGELQALLDDPTLFVEERLDDRVEALDFLTFAENVLHTEQRLHGTSPDRLLSRIQPLRAALEEADQALVDRMRAEIRSVRNRRTALRARFNRFTRYPAGTTGYRHIDFDGLDALLAGVLLTEPPPDPVLELEAEMIAYQATPASVVLELVDRVTWRAEDVFYDLGSGLGLVVLLVNLLTGIRARGIEIDPALCSYADRCAARMALSGVTFDPVDARTADFSSGTIFYLFTPFVGRMLRAVLDRLRQEARARTILVSSYGPCTPMIAAETWLVPLDTHGGDAFKLALFRSR